MRDSESRSSRHRRQGTRSTSRDRDRDRNRDRREKIVEREKDRERERGYRDRDYDRDYNSRQYRSKTPSTHSRHSHSKRSKAKKSKKHKRHSSSSDDNSHFSDCSDTSKGSRVSSASRSSRVSKKSSSLHTRTNSPDGNSSSLPATVSTAAAAKPDKIDLNDTKVRAALETIDEDAFVPKTFYSTRDREAPVKAPTSEKVIIDLSTETVSLPKPPAQKNMEIETTNEIFHPNFLGDLQQKNERWTKKLFNYRQKCFRE